MNENNTEEEKLYRMIEKSGGKAVQSELVEKSGFGKVKVARVLKNLEGKRLIERKRMGMTNIVIIREEK